MSLKYFAPNCKTERFHEFRNEDWFEKAGLKVDSRKIKAQPFNEFYQDKAILDRIIQVTWGGKIKPEQAIKILQNDTIDYVLKHA